MAKAHAVRTTDFDYDLPGELIAQVPAPARDASRLLVLHRKTGQIEHRWFNALPAFLRDGDVLVHNNSRVIPARLFGRNRSTSGQFEILLIEENARNDWWAMLKPGKRARVGTEIELRKAGEPSSIWARVIEVNAEGHRRLHFEGTDDLLAELDRLGTVPLPPYIARPARESDRLRYQTVYAATPGSVAAPTAGLHFTESLMDNLRCRRIRSCFVTLHVGLGTFAPVKAEQVTEHIMHEERFELPSETVLEINAARPEQRRVIAVGTTALRVLESAAAELGESLTARKGRTRIFIYPPYQFRVVDALLTNFHLPRSTLLMLVSAFAAPDATHGRELILNAYREAIRERYRFFSYGDAMLLV